MKKLIKYLFLAFSIFIISCTEPYALQTNTFEDVLVIEATITNELKKQEIKISRTYTLEEFSPKYETGAIVHIQDNTGIRYDFEEIDGKYISVNEFEAEANKEYQLFIKTNDGELYTSTSERLTTVNEIQSLTTNVVTKEGQKGVEIIVNTYDPTNTSKYYRYEYEETNRITAPKWSDFTLQLNYSITNCGIFGLSPGFPTIDKVPKNNLIGKVCYKRDISKEIILNSTANLTEDRVTFPVRFINSTDYLIAERYSILVTQYVQNLESHIFYKTLKKTSETGNLLSQNQPGFISGNIKANSDINKKVIGLFDVNSVSKKRIFLNYIDVFPTDPTPNYYENCEEITLCPINYDGDGDIPFYAECDISPICGDSDSSTGSSGGFLISNITTKKFLYYNGSPTFFMVRFVCGDCSTIGSTLKPLFWID